MLSVTALVISTTCDVSAELQNPWVHFSAYVNVFYRDAHDLHVEMQLMSSSGLLRRKYFNLAYIHRS